MDTNNQINSDVSEGLRKAKKAWHIARNRINEYMDADPQLKLIFLNS